MIHLTTVNDTGDDELSHCETADDDFGAQIRLTTAAPGITAWLACSFYGAISSPEVAYQKSGMLEPMNAYDSSGRPATDGVFPTKTATSTGVAHLLTQQPSESAVDSASITRWLSAWSEGSMEAVDRLIPLVYTELRQIAARLMVGEAEQTLQPTSLVHEAYFRLLEQRRVAWRDRQHFFAIAARIMRRVIIDAARSRSRWKRGGRDIQIPFDEAAHAFFSRRSEYLALDDALGNLEQVHPQRAAIIELRIFGGFTQEETAEALGASRATVTRQYKLAKAWLHRRLRADPQDAKNTTS